MSVKLNHYWSIIPGMDDACVKFITREFIPRINNLGLHTVAVWSVLIGAYSEIVMETAATDLEIIEKALKDKEYKHLKQELLKVAKNYQTKILFSTGKVDSYTTDVEKDTIKFNQMWDIRSHEKEAYDHFIINEYFPVLNELEISVAGEWEVLIGDGPGIICEGRVSDYAALIGNLQDKTFQTAKRKLKQFIENYQSRVLTFYIRN